MKNCTHLGFTGSWNIHAPADAGYPTSDNVSDTVAAKYSDFGNALASFAQKYSQHQAFSAEVAGELPNPAQFTMAPPEWPMAWLAIHLPSVQAYFKQELFRTVLHRRLIGQYAAARSPFRDYF